MSSKPNAKRKTLQPWDQRKGEPDRWYARFKVFMSLGLERSIAAVYRQEHPDKSTPSMRESVCPRNWSHASSRWDWRPRAGAWDVFQANDLANRVAKKVEKAHQTIVDGAARVAAKIIERAESIIALVPAYKDPGDTTAKFIETRKYRDGLELLKGVLELSERITGRVPRPGQQRPGDDDMGGDGPGHDAPAPAAVREAEFLDELIGHGTGNNADRGTSQLDAGDDAPAGQPGGGNGDGPA